MLKRAEYFTETLQLIVTAGFDNLETATGFYVIIKRECVLITLLLVFPSVARKSHLYHTVTKPSLDIAAASQRG